MKINTQIILLKPTTKVCKDLENHASLELSKDSPSNFNLNVLVELTS